MDYYLARLPVFRRLPEDVRERLGELFLLRDYPKGRPVFEEGDPPGRAYLLRSGLAKAVKYSPRVEPFAMGIIVPGQLFGMIAVLDKKPYPVTILPLQDSEAYGIPVPVFDELLREHPDFSREVFSQVGGHLRQAQAMRSLAKESVEKRIAFVLCQLYEALGAELPVRREDVAELSSCTPETASRVLAGLRSRRLIASGWKRVTVLKPDGLRSLF